MSDRKISGTIRSRVVLIIGMFVLVFALYFVIRSKERLERLQSETAAIEAKNVAVEQKRQKELEETLQTLVLERLVDRLDLLSARGALMDIYNKKLDADPMDVEALRLAEDQAPAVARAIEKLTKSLGQFEKMVTRPSPKEKELIDKSKQGLANDSKRLDALKDKIATLKK